MDVNMNFQKDLYSLNYFEIFCGHLVPNKKNLVASFPFLFCFFIEYFWYYVLQDFICMTLSHLIFEYKASRKISSLITLRY